MLQTIVIIMIILGIASFVKGSSKIKTPLSHWHHRFDTVPFSSQDFYHAVEDTIKVKLMNRLSTSRFSYSQGGFLSPHREYLRIRYGQLVYDICAAPFGKGYFVSWWLGEESDSFADFFINLPLIGNSFTKRKKTFFELDTEIMFKEIVSACVKEVIDELSAAKGVRQLSEADWREYNQPILTGN